MQDLAKVSLRDIELELARRKTSDPLAHVYQPHAGQVEAHCSRAPFTLVLGGNRAGKSWFAVAEALLYCLGRSTYAEMPSHGKPVVVWYVMPSLTMFRRTVYPIFRQLVPGNDLASWSERDNIAKFNNGSTLHFLSADMRQRRLQGASVDLIIMDETPNEAVFEELQARVIDRKGRIVLVFAPIDAASYWVRDNLYIPWQTGERRDIDVVFMPVADKEGNPLVPHLSKEDVQQMEQQWPDPAVRAARIYGEFVTRAGIVLKNYDPELHLVTPFKIPKHFTRWMIIDPQYHRFGALYFAADEHGNYFVTNEYFSQDDPLAHRAERLKVMVGNEGDKAIPAYVDSANQQDIVELNWHFQRIGAPIGATQLPFPKRVDDMILRVQSMMEPDPEREHPKALGKEYKGLFGSPRIFMFNDLASDWRLEGRRMRCSRLLWEMSRYSWGNNGKPDKNSADGADCVDCLVYGCSIKAVSIAQTERNAWEKNMPLKDVLLWRAIEQQDRRKDRWLKD